MISQRSIRVLRFLAVAVLSMTTLIVWPGTFVDDFSDNKPDGWKRVGGTWKIKDGGYHGVEPGGVEGAVLIGDPKWVRIIPLRSKCGMPKVLGWQFMFGGWISITTTIGGLIWLTSKEICT